MQENNPLFKISRSQRIHDFRSLKTFLSALALILTARSVQRLLSRTRKNRRKGETALDGTAVRTALFPALLPQIYRYLRQRFGGSGLAETTSSSLLFLLPSSWRIHVVLYAASSALYHSARNSHMRRYFPPTWTLNVIGNALLLWTFLFKNEAFPSTYEKIIISNSTHYIPRDMTKKDLEKLLHSTKFSETNLDAPSTHSQHAYDLCSKLHPTESSCLRNYLKACFSESLRSCWWVGSFSLLPILVSRERRDSVRRTPLAFLQNWLYSTTRGTVFVSASITTAWGMTCLLQRLLPRDRLKRARWLINASVASLWILILPDKRRNEISLYVARLAALCAWRAWRLEGGASLPLGDLILFVLSWIQLVRLQKRGEKISGLVGYAMAKVQ